MSRGGRKRARERRRCTLINHCSMFVRRCSFCSYLFCSFHVKFMLCLYLEMTYPLQMSMTVSWSLKNEMVVRLCQFHWQFIDTVHSVCVWWWYLVWPMVTPSVSTTTNQWSWREKEKEWYKQTHTHTDKSAWLERCRQSLSTGRRSGGCWGSIKPS